MTDQLLVVELVEPVPASRLTAVATHASKRLGIPVDRVRKLLDARVGPITRALRADKAEVIAEAFEAAGARVVIRLAEPEESEVTPTARTASSPELPAAAAASFGSPSDWGVETGMGWSPPGATEAPPDPSSEPRDLHVSAGEGELASSAPWETTGTDGAIVVTDNDDDYFDDGLDDDFDPTQSHPALAVVRAERGGGRTGADVAHEDSVSDADLDGVDLPPFGARGAEHPAEDEVAAVGEAAPPADAGFDDDEERWPTPAADDPIPVAPPFGGVPAFDADVSVARHTPPPLPWVPRAERSPAGSATPVDDPVLFGGGDDRDDDFDFTTERPQRRTSPEEQEAFREIWDDPVARQRRRTFMGALLVVAVFVFIGLQWWLAQRVEPTVPPSPAAGAADGVGIEVLPPNP
jgi:hypothetical protein